MTEDRNGVVVAARMRKTPSADELHLSPTESGHYIEMFRRHAPEWHLRKRAPADYVELLVERAEGASFTDIGRKRGLGCARGRQLVHEAYALLETGNLIDSSVPSDEFRSEKIRRVRLDLERGRAIRRLPKIDAQIAKARRLRDALERRTERLKRLYDARIAKLDGRREMLVRAAYG